MQPRLACIAISGGSSCPPTGSAAAAPLRSSASKPGLHGRYEASSSCKHSSHEQTSVSESDSERNSGSRFGEVCYYFLDRGCSTLGILWIPTFHAVFRSSTICFVRKSKNWNWNFGGRGNTGAVNGAVKLKTLRPTALSPPCSAQFNVPVTLVKN